MTVKESLADSARKLAELERRIDRLHDTFGVLLTLVRPTRELPRG